VFADERQRRGGLRIPQLQRELVHWSTAIVPRWRSHCDSVMGLAFVAIPTNRRMSTAVM
jgi:hypothetical protein